MSHTSHCEWGLTLKLLHSHFLKFCLANWQSGNTNLLLTLEILILPDHMFKLFSSYIQIKDFD